MADARPYAGAASIDWQPLLDAIDDRLDERFKPLEEKLDSLDGYVRNHLTSKMNKRFDEVNDGLAVVSKMLQDHIQLHP